MKRLLVTTDVNEALHFVEGFTSKDIFSKRKPVNEYDALTFSRLGVFSTRLGFEPMTIITLKDRRFDAEKIAINMAKEGLQVAIEDDEGDMVPYHSLKDIEARELILREALYKMPSHHRSSGREDILASNNLLLYSNSPSQIRAFQ